MYSLAILVLSLIFCTSIDYYIYAFNFWADFEYTIGWSIVQRNLPFVILIQGNNALMKRIFTKSSHTKNKKPQMEYLIL